MINNHINVTAYESGEAIPDWGRSAAADPAALSVPYAQPVIIGGHQLVSSVVPGQTYKTGRVGISVSPVGDCHPANRPLRLNQDQLTHRERAN